MPILDQCWNTHQRSEREWSWKPRITNVTMLCVSFLGGCRSAVAPHTFFWSFQSPPVCNIYHHNRGNCSIHSTEIDVSGTKVHNFSVWWRDKEGSILFLFTVSCGHWTQLEIGHASTGHHTDVCAKIDCALVNGHSQTPRLVSKQLANCYRLSGRLSRSRSAPKGSVSWNRACCCFKCSIMGDQYRELPNPIVLSTPAWYNVTTKKVLWMRLMFAYRQSGWMGRSR